MSIRLAILSLLASSVSATPVGLGTGHSNHTLDLRDNPVSCGWNNQFPCAAGQYCYTSNNQALCGSSPQTQAGGGGYAWYTTTYTVSQTFTYTSTYSSAIGGATAGACASGSSQCVPGLCCNIASQWCDTSGTPQCRPLAANSPSPGGGSFTQTVVTTMTISGTPTTISNYIAPTSITTSTITSTGTATTTEAFITPIGSSGAEMPGVTAVPQSSGGGLSGGAIAGIVIGVLLGLFILFVILACLCCKGIFDLIFGKKEKKETTTYIHTHHSAHGSAAGRPSPRRWFGMLPGKADRPNRPQKESSGLGGMLTVAGILAGIAVALGLKRRSDRRREEEKTEYTQSAGSYSYYSDDITETSESSVSSDDRRTRHTQRSRSRSRR